MQKIQEKTFAGQAKRRRLIENTYLEKVRKRWSHISSSDSSTYTKLTVKTRLQVLRRERW